MWPIKNCHAKSVYNERPVRKPGWWIRRGTCGSPSLGFLLEPEGWGLSPVYDMNPDPYADDLKLNISDVDNALEMDLALEIAPYFRVKDSRARSVTAEVVSAVKQWRPLAETLKISREEIECMEPAFRVADAL